MLLTGSLPASWTTGSFGLTQFTLFTSSNVHVISQKDAEAWWRDFVREVTAAIAKKMSFGDALLLREAENYNAEAIVTWNTKDFSRRTRLAVLTPTGFLRQH